MSTPAPKGLPQTPAQNKFTIEKQTVGAITLLTLHGTLDHAFEGKKVAETVNTKKLVVSMADVSRFASWGMSEWMDFLRITAERDLYLVECSTYAVSQINLVTGLLGHGKLVSFYASYRCGSCSEEFQTLFVIPRDRDAIRDLPGSSQDCATCGGRARMEEYPAAFFETIAERPPFDIDDDVLALFRSQLDYDLTPDLTRFRAYRRAVKGYTYLRLTGALSKVPSTMLANASEGTTVVDLEQVVFDPAQVSQWRTYVKAALAKLPALQLINCPPGFLESAVQLEDLHDKLKIRTFALAYHCPRCDTWMTQLVDVAENLEQLVRGTAPTARCPACQALLVAAPSPDQVKRLRSLPARVPDVALDAFLAKARSEPVEKLEDCLVAGPVKRPTAPAGSGRAMYVAIGLTGLIIVGLVVVAWSLWKERTATAPVVATQTPVVTPPVTPPPAFQRPDWLVSDVPSSAYCQDLINRLMCVGVSSYRPTRDEAVSEANEAALEELVSAVGLKISDARFREEIMPAYSEVRAKALAALQAADLDRTSAAYAAAADVVGKARKRVVELLQVTGGAAVPAQRTDWYWEEYSAKMGGTEVLVFVRYDISLDAMKVLVDKYSTATPVLDSSVTTAFPALAWAFPDFTGGALLTKVGRSFTDAGIAVDDVVMAVGEHRVTDVRTFARRIEEAKLAATPGPLKLTVKSGEAPARVVDLKRAK
ncbi:MAG: hypothetical protein H0T79_18280 [Deltaproteobacteria bacterium]|nr:hypothetical protein [Deltaproteobacteria bacterium]